MQNVYVVGSEHKNDQVDLLIYANRNDAISYAGDLIQKMCNVKSKIRQLNVAGYIYFAINLSEGILVYVQDKTIVYTTSSSYALNIPVGG